MVITQREFHKALEEINSSYSKLLKRLEDLEAEVRKAPTSSPKSTTTAKKS